jgi:hypothetical protein
LFSGTFVLLPFLPNHVSCRNDSDPLFSKGIDHQKEATGIRLAQGKVPKLVIGMEVVFGGDQRLIEEDLLAFRL